MEESTFEALGESLAGNDEWTSTGMLVQVHELIDPCSEAAELDVASILGDQAHHSALDLSSEVIHMFRIYFACLFFEFTFRTYFSHLIFAFKFRI